MDSNIDVVLEILGGSTTPISKAEIMVQSKEIGKPFTSLDALQGAIRRELQRDFPRVEVIKTVPLTYKKSPEIPVEKQILVENVVEVIENIDVKKLRLQNERELELVMFGALQGSFGDAVKYRENIGGRTCDLGMKNIAIEMKYIKSQADKDRVAGQIIDYLKDVKSVIVVALDEKGLLKDSPIGRIKGVNLITF
jgi:hypothetical protein